MGLPISPDIAQLIPYSPGKPIEELERELGIRRAVKLASNENPLGPSKKALAAIRKAMRTLHRYPEGSGNRLVEAISERNKVSPDGIVLGNGSNEIIELVVRAFLQPGDQAVMADLTFVVYQMIVRAAHGEPVTAPLHEGCHDLQEMLRRVTDRTRLIFVCNPNNPTGTIVRQQQVDEFMDRVPDGVIVVFDEAYYEYVTDRAFPSGLNYLQQGRDVLVLRTFSKIYGLAGLRIGYGLASRPIAEMLQRVRQPFNTNRLAQVAALAALTDDDHVRKSREVNEEGKRYLLGELGKMGLQTLPSEANFLYINMGRPGGEVYADLLRLGVIVRHIQGEYIRITIGLARENRRLIRSLKRVLTGRGKTSDGGNQG